MMMFGDLMNHDVTISAIKEVVKSTWHHNTEFRTECSDTKTK